MKRLLYDKPRDEVVSDNTDTDKITHGVDCTKEPHIQHGNRGYLHSATDDGPYDVDGHTYCGRCHRWVGE